MNRVATFSYVAALAVALFVLALLGPLERKAGMIGSDDFANIWVGARVYVTGHDPYDPATWRQTVSLMGTAPTEQPIYLYPPWAILLVLPVAALPIAVATPVWTAAGLGAAGAAVGILCRRLLPGRSLMHAAAAVTLLLSGPAVSTFLTGQWSFILVAALAGLVLALRSGHATVAGLLTIAMLAKPQLFLLAAPALAVRALWSSPIRPEGLRFVLVAAGSGAAIITLSWLLLPSWWPAWPTLIGPWQLVPDHATVEGLLFRELGPVGTVAALGLLAAMIAVASRFHPRGPAWIPVWLTLSVVAAPYANPYDLLILLVPGIVAAAAAGPGSPRAAIILGGTIAILLLGATLLHYFALLRYAALVPLAMYALVVAGLWDARRDRTSLGI